MQGLSLDLWAWLLEEGLLEQGNSRNEGLLQENGSQK